MVINIVGIVDNFVDKMLITLCKLVLSKSQKIELLIRSVYNSMPGLQQIIASIDHRRYHDFYLIFKLQKCTKYKLYLKRYNNTVLL